MSHGKWLPYKPEKLPDDAPPHALFCRRKSDWVDWYDYARDASNFTAGSVKFTALKQDAGWIIGAASYDVTMLHPANQMVLEIIDYLGGDPQEELGDRLFDLATLRLGERPIVIPPDPLQPILERLAVIEAKLGITP